MTSQIVLLNKYGAALASDSSLTMERGEDRRTYASAEKILPLKDPHKVAVMHSGTTILLGHPFEILLTQWEVSLNRTLPRLDSYADDFIAFLSHRQELFGEESQQEFFRRRCDEYLLEIRDVILDKLADQNIVAAMWKEESVLSLVLEILDKDIKWLDGCSEWSGLSDKWAITRFSDYQEVCVSSIEYVFDDVPWNSECESKAVEICKRLLYKSTGSYKFDATLAFVGFGDSEMYPSHTYVRVQGMIGDKPRFEKASDSITQTYGSNLRTHAQDEAIHTYLRGYHREFLNIAKSEQDGLISQIRTKIEDGTESGGISDELAANLHDALNESRNELSKKISDAFTETSERRFVDPFVSTLAGLPPASLAKMSESLIELQILRQSSQAVQDTVGGPVDVATITLGGGFQWFRHKTVEDLWTQL